MRRSKTFGMSIVTAEGTQPLPLEHCVCGGALGREPGWRGRLGDGRHIRLNSPNSTTSLHRLTSPNLGFPVCKMGIRIGSYLRRDVRSECPRHTVPGAEEVASQCR